MFNPPARRNPREVKQLLAELQQWLRKEPTAGVVAGTLDLRPPGSAEGFRIDLGTVDFTPLHYVALADAALERAHERFAEAGLEHRELMEKIERARAELDLQVETAH